jgi:hypothetical protein
VAGWHAHGAGGSELRAILPGDLSRGFLFRRVEGQASGARIAVEYRSMACRFDPQATIPEAAFGEPGTVTLK